MSDLGGAIIGSLPVLEGAVLIAASSFERRSVRGSALLAASKIDRAAIFLYEDTLESGDGRRNHDEISLHLMQATGSRSTVLRCIYQDPYSVVRQLRSWAAVELRESQPARFIVDITCFTKLHLILLMRELRSAWPGVQVHILYTEPLVYADSVRKTLSYGVADTVYIPIETVNGDHGSTALVIMLGHERVRAQRVIDEVEADVNILLIGRNTRWSSVVRASEAQHRHLIERARYNAQYVVDDVENMDFSAMAKKLESLAEELRASRGIDTMYVCPLGTKVQAVGVHVFATQRHGMRIVLAYAVPKRFEKTDYSHGWGDTHIWTLPKSITSFGA